MKSRIFIFLTLLIACFGLLSIVSNNKVTYAAGDETTVTSDLDSINVSETAIISFPVTYKSVYGNEISWSVNSGQDIIKYDEEAHWMVVDRSKVGEDGATVDLTVTVKGANNEESKTFSVKVPYGFTAAPTYQITYTGDEGTLPDDIKTSYKLGEDTYVLPTLTRADYVFKGWYEGETKVEKILVGSMKDYELEARWEAKAMTSFDIVKGEGFKSSYKGGETLSLDGLTLTAHYNDGTKVENIAVDASNVNVTQVNWNESGKVTVTVTYGELTNSFEVDVVKNTFDLSSIKLEETTTKVYNGEAQTLAWSGTLPEGLKVVVEGSAKDVADGKQTIKLSVVFDKDHANYESLKNNYEAPTYTLSGELTITPLEIDMSKVEFNDKTTTYDGNEHKIEVTNLPELVTATYKVGENTFTSATNASTYNVVATFDTDDNHSISINQKEAKLVIEQKAVTLTPTAKTISIKDANSISWEFTADGFVNSDDLNVLTVQPEPKYYIDGAETPLSAGKTYVVKFTGATADNYKITVADSSLTINAETLIFEFSNFDGLVYNGSNQMFEAKAYAQQGNNDKVQITDATVKYTLKDNGTEFTGETNAGTYTVTVSIDSPTYGKLSQDVDFVIAKAENVVSNLTIADWTYGSTASTPSASALDNATITYTYAPVVDGVVGEYTDTVPSYAGKYYVKATAAETTNYNEATATIEFTINKFEIVIPENTFVDLNTPYTGSNIMINAKEISGVKVEYVDSSNSPFTGATEVGTYQVTAKFTPEDLVNNTVSVDSMESTLTITQADNAISDFVVNDWTFEDDAIAPTASANFGNVVFTYATEENGTYTADVPTNAGTYYVKAEVAETPNYKGASETKSFTIARKALVEGDLNITVNGSDWNAQNVATHKPGVTVLYGENEFTSFETTYTYADEVTKIGTATITLTLTGNYSGEFEVSFNIAEFGQAHNDLSTLPSELTEEILSNNYTLPLKANDSNVSWTSSSTAVKIDATGKVTVVKGATDEEVTITAIVTYGETSADSKVYTVTITKEEVPAYEDITSADGSVTILQAPAGSTVTATEAADNANYKTAVFNSNEYQFITAYDIKLQDSEGTAIQPNGTVTVRIKGTFDSTKAYKVYYIDESNNSTPIVCAVASDGSYIEFETDHFSVYAIGQVIETKTVSEMLALTADETKYYKVSGTVTEIYPTSGNVYITDGTNTIYIYKMVSEYGETSNNISSLNIVLGDTLTIIGTRYTYQTTEEITNAFYVSKSKNTCNVSVSVNDDLMGSASVDKLSVENGSTVKLTVIPNAGYVVSNIKVNDEDLTLNDSNSYDITVSFNAEIIVTFINESEVSNNPIITFKGTDAANDSNSALDTNAYSSHVDSSDLFNYYVNSVIKSEKVYNGKSNKGLKFSSSSANGILGLKLNVYVSGVKLYIEKYNDKKVSVNVNDKIQSITSNGYYEFEFDKDNQLSISASFENDRRFYLKSIELILATVSNAELLASDMSEIPSEMIVTDNSSFVLNGNNGTTFVWITKQDNDFVKVEGNIITVNRPTAEQGNQTIYMTVTGTNGDTTPVSKDVKVIVKAIPVPTKLDAPILSLEGNIVKWDAVENATQYIVKVNSEEITTIDDLFYEIQAETSGEYVIEVIAVPSAEEFINSNASTITYILTEYTITFYANDGTQNFTIQTAIEGFDITLNANSFTNGTKVFNGWSMTENGDIKYIDNQSITMPSNDLKLYAIWIEEAVKTLSETYTRVENQGTFSNNNETLTINSDNNIFQIIIDKHNSTNNIVNSYSPFRLYKGTKLTIQLLNSQKIVSVKIKTTADYKDVELKILCDNSSKYITTYDESTTSKVITVSEDTSILQIETGAQIRFSKIVVDYISDSTQE